MGPILLGLTVSDGGVSASSGGLLFRGKVNPHATSRCRVGQVCAATGPVVRSQFVPAIPNRADAVL